MKRLVGYLLISAATIWAVGCGSSVPAPTYQRSLPPDGVPPMPVRYKAPVEVPKKSKVGE